MTLTPRISIVTPCFNHARWIEPTIQSVLGQGYPNLEYVVIDGGSTDGSREIIERCASKLTYWESEPDRGHAHALNKGFAHTTGEIMGWLNSDDLYQPWAFETVAEIFQAFPEVQWITGTAGGWDERGRLIRALDSYKNVYDYLLGSYAWIQQESTFWRRSLWDAAGGMIDESYKLMVDGNLWSRFFLHAPLHHVACSLAGFRWWGGNRSATQLEGCHAEMRRTIAAMRERCDAKTLRTAELLGHARRAAERLRGAPVRPLARRLLARPLEQAAYEGSCYVDGKWIPIRYPFVL